jgi:hypothetical protein
MIVLTNSKMIKEKNNKICKNKISVIKKIQIEINN